jgi:hypothetical protein
MPRFDKYGPYVGGFRAKLAVALAAADVGKVWAVGLNASGQVVLGAGSTGIIAVICAVRTHAIGEQIDCMTDGEIGDFTLQNGSAAAAGTRYFGVAADGTWSTTNTGTRLGWTAEATRLIVRVGRGTNPTT